MQYNGKGSPWDLPLLEEVLPRSDPTWEGSTWDLPPLEMGLPVIWSYWGRFYLCSDPTGEGGNRSENGEWGSDFTLSPYPLSLELMSDEKKLSKR